MPIYEYRCKKGHTFEVLQRMADDALDSCETCDAPAERVLHAPAVHFKGSGFYNTDYGTKKRAREKSAESKGSPNGGGKGGDGTSKGGDGSSSDTKKLDTTPAKKSESSAA